MAYDGYLDLTDIEGEATAKGFEKKIGIYSFSWGASNSGGVDPGRGGLAAGRVTMSDMTFMKQVDKSTPKLLEALCRGTHIAKAKLVLRKATGSEQEGFFTIELEDVLITSVSQSGSAQGEERPTESVSMCFAKVGLEYKVQGKDGKLTQGGMFEFDQTTVA